MVTAQFPRRTDDAKRRVYSKSREGLHMWAVYNGLYEPTLPHLAAPYLLRARAMSVVGLKFGLLKGRV